MTRELVLGIDFGSSSTIAGVLINDRIELVQDAGDSVIPSVVYIPDRGETLVGRRAVARQIGEPSNVIRSVKRLLGLDSTSELVRRYAASTPLKLELSTPKPIFKLRSGPLAPEQVAAAIIGYVRGLAEQRFGVRISKAVMTMSAGAPPKRPRWLQGVTWSSSCPCWWNPGAGPSGSTVCAWSIAILKHRSAACSPAAG